MKTSAAALWQWGHAVWHSEWKRWSLQGVRAGARAHLWQPYSLDIDS